MLKTLRNDNTTITPYIASKTWNLSNVDNSDLILSEAGNPLALETVIYTNNQPITNSNCDLALEKQSLDLVRFREGQKLDGLFYPDQDPLNFDGTFKRLVYNQIKTMFYNNYRDPTKMWGMENVDFDLSGTKKFISDLIKVYDVPTNIYGEKIKEGTISIQDFTQDNDYLITDDGKCNLYAGKNLFSHFQEIGQFLNLFASGSSSICNAYFGLPTGSPVPPPPPPPPPPAPTSSCHFSMFPAQLFVSTLQTTLTYDLV